MKPLTNTLKFLDSDTAKNVIIFFGFVLSIFTITSFDSFSNSEKEFSVNEIQQSLIDQKGDIEEAMLDNASVNNSKKAKTHHNFIASYFLQESSIKRERKTPDNEVGTAEKILYLHKILMSAVISSF